MDQLVHAARILLVHMAGTEPRGDVLADGEPVEQRALLKHEAAPVGRPADGLAVQRELAALGLVEPGDQAQGRGLATAGGSQERDELAPAHIQAHVGEGLHGSSLRRLVGAAHVPQAQRNVPSGETRVLPRLLALRVAQGHQATSPCLLRSPSCHRSARASMMLSTLVIALNRIAMTRIAANTL